VKDPPQCQTARPPKNQPDGNNMSKSPKKSGQKRARRPMGKMGRGVQFTEKREGKGAARFGSYRLEGKKWEKNK